MKLITGALDSKESENDFHEIKCVQIELFLKPLSFSLHDIATGLPREAGKIELSLPENSIIPIIYPKNDTGKEMLEYARETWVGQEVNGFTMRLVYSRIQASGIPNHTQTE